MKQWLSLPPVPALPANLQLRLAQHPLRPKLPFRVKLRSVRHLALAILFFFLLAKWISHTPRITIPRSALPFQRAADPKLLVGPECAPPARVTRPEPGLAAPLSPAELLCRPLAVGRASVPKLFHQSWPSGALPAKFARWSRSCRERHPSWEWVLWKDDDNLVLVQKYFPWLEDTYLNLPNDIYRADLARNLYMYLFGGVYADVDTECLRPTAAALDAYNVSHPESNKTLSSTITPGHPVALLGLMGKKPKSEHHIPNAWMAASPGHPFFVLPLEAAVGEITKSRRPLHEMWYEYPSAERMTGPIALRKSVMRYAASGRNATDKVLLLPEEWVYPFNWAARGKGIRRTCSVEHTDFDEDWCKRILDVGKKGSLTITYWSHTYRGKSRNMTSIAGVDKDD